MGLNNPFDILAQRLDGIELLLQSIAQNNKIPPTSSGNSPSEYLTRQQAAIEMGVCITTIDNLSKMGKLKKYRSGRIVRLRKSELMEALETFKGGWSRQFERNK